MPFPTSKAKGRSNTGSLMRNRQRVEKSASSLFVLCICFCRVESGRGGEGSIGSVPSACRSKAYFIFIVAEPALDWGGDPVLRSVGLIDRTWPSHFTSSDLSFSKSKWKIWNNSPLVSSHVPTYWQAATRCCAEHPHLAVGEVGRGGDAGSVMDGCPQVGFWRRQSHTIFFPGSFPPCRLSALQNNYI